jgi:multiple sugar transport system substrate-binding protein
MKTGQWVGTVALLGACGSATPAPVEDPPVTLSFLRHDNSDYVRADDAAFASYTAAHPKVTVSPMTIRYPTLGSTLLAELKADRLAADLVRVQPSWVCSFADNLADVPEEVLSLGEAQSTFFAAPLSGSVCNGKLKGLPIEYNLEYGGVVVNVDKYQSRYGRSPSWGTWRDFIREASELTEYDASNNPAANGLDIAPDWPQPVKHIFFSQILQRGARYTSGDVFDFTTQAAADALTDMVSWVKTDHVMYPSLIPQDNTFVTTRLAVGTAGYGWGDPARPLSVMGYCGTWGVPATAGQVPKGSQSHYDYFTVPPMVGSEHRFVQNSGWALVVPRTSKNQRVAWDVARSLALDPTAMKKWNATTGSLPALRVNGTPEAATSDPMLAKVQPLLEKGQWVGYIPAAAIETVEGAIVSNFFAVVKGTKDVARALADMQMAANNAVAKSRQ